MIFRVVRSYTQTPVVRPASMPIANRFFFLIDVLNFPRLQNIFFLRPVAHERETGEADRAVPVRVRPVIGKEMPAFAPCRIERAAGLGHAVDAIAREPRAELLEIVPDFLYELFHINFSKSF